MRNSASITKRKLEMMKFLATVVVEVFCKSKCLPLRAVQQNNIAIVRLLINCLADINAPNKDGLSPLHYAIGYRRFEIAEVLLQAKIQMYAASNHGVTAMTVAVEHDVPYMVRLLCQYGYDVSTVCGIHSIQA